MKYYILRNKRPVEVPMMEWAKWFESGDRVVEKTEIIYRVKGAHILLPFIQKKVEVSTVFIGIDYQMFETMIFGGDHDEYQVRTKTYQDAEFAHAAAVSLVTKEAIAHGDCNYKLSVI